MASFSCGMWLRKINSGKVYYSFKLKKRWIRRLINILNEFKRIFLNGLSPPIISDAFMIRNNKYNLRNFQCLYSTNKRTVKYGTETVTYRGPQIWNLVPEKTKNASSFDIFKKKIGKWKGEKCSCRICKTYIQHVGFIWKNCSRL